MKRISLLAWRPMLMASGIGLASASADTVITSCTEAALDAALATGGRIVLTCSGTIPHQSTKVIGMDTILEAGAGMVTLNGSGSNRLFTINPGVTLTLRGLTLARGNHQGVDGSDGAELDSGENGKPGFGGAIFNDGGTLIAEGVTFATNQVTGGNGGLGFVGTFFGAHGRDGGRGGAGTGGAIHNLSGQLRMTNCTFIANQAVGGEGGAGGDGSGAVLTGDGGDGGNGGHGRGGAIHSEGESEVNLVGCTFDENRSEGGLGGEPGWAGGLTAFDGNPGTAGNSEGGALHGLSGSAVGLRSTFSRNEVLGADGLDGLEGFASRTGMDGRRGGISRGGALAFGRVTAAFTNSTFFGNSATGGAGGDGGEGGDRGFGGDGGDGGRGGSARGGSVYHGSASAGTYVHCTFSSGSITGGVGGAGGAAGTDIANRGGHGSTGVTEGANLATDSEEVSLFFTIVAFAVGSSNSHGQVMDGGFNLSSDSTPPFTIGGGLNNTDPLLSTLGQNGGPTLTMALQPESPARNQNTDLLLVAIDQRGYGRLDLPDIGAYEYDAAAGLQIVGEGEQIIVSWPVLVPPAQLQSAISLLTPNWQMVSGAVQSGSVFVITNAVSDSARFYRLSPQP